MPTQQSVTLPLDPPPSAWPPPSSAAAVPPAPRSSAASAAEPAGGAWAAHPSAALTLQAAIVLVPAFVSALVSWVLGRVLPNPGNVVATVLRVAVIIGISAVALLASRRALRRLAPLTFLLRLSLAFPDEAPTRLGVALRSTNVRKLETAGNDTTGDLAGQIVAMAGAINAHHRSTRGHSERVRAYAELIGAELGLEESDLEKLRWAALLHDLGKTKVPVEVLDLNGRPNAEQWAVLAAHPAAGEQLSVPLREWLGPWWHGIGQHHEKWDGSGYPAQLAGEDIALSGRIVALADAYETMTAVRSYKQPMSAAAAREEVVRCAGAHFDPIVVRAFLAIGLGRLRRVMGLAAWLPMQVIALIRIPAKIGASLAQLPSMGGSAMAQLPAVVAVTGSIGIAAVIPQVREAALRVEPAAAATASSATAAAGPASEFEMVVPDSTGVDPGSSVLTPRPGARPSQESVSEPTTTAAVSGAPATDSTVTAQPAEDLTTTTGVDLTATTIERPTTSAARATPAPSSTALPTTSTAAVTTTTVMATTTVPTAPAPVFLTSPSFTWTGDGRHLQASPGQIDSAGLAVTCTLWVPDTPAYATGPCDTSLAVDLPMWNTPYAVMFQASTTAGLSAVAGATMSSLPKTLLVDASSHWPCPGWFCSASARGFSAPSVLSLSAIRSVGTPEQLLCTVSGLAVDTRSPFSSGTEVSTKWVKSADPSTPYFSVLSFPTPGESAADGLPAC